MGKLTNTNSSDNKDGGTEGFFQKLFSILFHGSDPEKEKNRLLKEIAKTLKKHRLKYYNPKSEEALPGMGKFFYELYKIISPAQVLLENAGSSGALRSLIIDAYMSDEQKSII